MRLVFCIVKMWRHCSANDPWVHNIKMKSPLCRESFLIFQVTVMRIRIKCLYLHRKERCGMELLKNNIQEVRSLCEKHKVGKLFAFGSVLTDGFDDESDIDLVVDFKGVDLYDYADNYFNLKDALGKLFGREIDLLEEKAIRNPILKRNIDNTKRLIYG